MMAALESTLVGNAEEPLNLEQQSKSFAIAAVAYADALIAELNKPSLSSEVEPEVPALDRRSRCQSRLTWGRPIIVCPEEL